MQKPSIKHNKLFKQLRTAIIIILSGLLITLFFVQDIDYFFNNMTKMLLFALAYSLPLWFGNKLLSNNINKYFPWKKKPLKTLIISITATLIVSTLITITINYLMFIFLSGKEINTYQIQLKFIISILIITFIISLIFHSISFFKELKNAILREEKLKRNILELEYASLKNQVNPHFLFNSLNALTSLVADNDKAVKFIKKLSDVYRYLLETKDNEIIKLSSEIEFIKSYIYLLKIRFGDNLKTEIKINKETYKIVPLSLQLLIENAVKHNIISEDEPLFIQIYNTKDYIIVENNMQLKIKVNNSSKIGLENIKKRYSYLTEKKVIVKKTQDKFIVKIPLLTDNKNHN